MRLILLLMCAVLPTFKAESHEQVLHFQDVRRALGMQLQQRLPRDWLRRLKDQVPNVPILLDEVPFWPRWPASRAWKGPASFAADISLLRSANPSAPDMASYRGNHSTFGPYYDRSRPLHSDSVLRNSWSHHRGAKYATGVSLQSVDELLPWSRDCEQQSESVFANFASEMKKGCSPAGRIASLTPSALAAHATRKATKARLHCAKLPQRETHVVQHDWRYLTADVDVVLPRTAQQQRMSPLAPLLAVNPTQSSLNMWVGQGGVISPVHYDGDFNAYLQVVGLKRFHLWPPSAWRHLRPYPFLHPMHAQGSVNVSQDASYMRGMLVADLSPGNMLLLPAGWWHEVVAVTDSVSVNVWSASSDTQASTEDLFQLTTAHMSKYFARPVAARVKSPACKAARSLLSLVLRAVSANFEEQTPGARPFQQEVSPDGTTATAHDSSHSRRGCSHATREWLVETIEARFGKRQLLSSLGCAECASSQLRGIRGQIRGACPPSPLDDECAALLPGDAGFVHAAAHKVGAWPQQLVDTLAANWVEYALAIQYGSTDAACALTCTALQAV